MRITIIYIRSTVHVNHNNKTPTYLYDGYHSMHILYSAKQWQGKTLANLANCKSFVNILPNQIDLFSRLQKVACTCMTTNTIDNDTLTWILFHHSYRTAMVSSGQTLLSQGAYRLEIISASSRLAWVVQD